MKAYKIIILDYVNFNNPITGSFYWIVTKMDVYGPQKI